MDIKIGNVLEMVYSGNFAAEKAERNIQSLAHDNTQISDPRDTVSLSVNNCDEQDVEGLLQNVTNQGAEAISQVHTGLDPARVMALIQDLEFD